MTQLHALSDQALDQLFRHARTVHAFKPVPLSDSTLHQLYDLLKWGPKTSWSTWAWPTTVAPSRAGRAWHLMT